MMFPNKTIGSVCSFYGAILLTVVSFFIFGCNEESSSSGGSSGKTINIAAARAQSISNLKQIGTAALMYYQDYYDFLPDNLGSTIVTYMIEPKCFIAPFDQTSTPVKYNQDQWKNLSYGDQSLLAQELISHQNTSYAFIVPSQVKCSMIKSPCDFPLAFEKPWLLPENSDKIAVLYYDGHVEQKEIPGVSKLSCYEVAEKLTANASIDPQIRRKMLNKAGEIDRWFENQNSLILKSVQYEVPFDTADDGDPDIMRYAYLDNNKVEARAYKLSPQELMRVERFKNAELFTDEYGRVQVIFSLHKTAAMKFARITREHKGRQVAVIVDGKLYCAPFIQTEIPNGSLTIINLSREEAEKIVKKLQKQCIRE